MQFSISESAKMSNSSTGWKDMNGSCAIGATKETVGVNGSGNKPTVTLECRSVLFSDFDIKEWNKRGIRFSFGAIWPKIQPAKKYYLGIFQ